MPVTASSISYIPAAPEYSCTSGQVKKAAWSAKEGEKKTWEGQRGDLSKERASEIVHCFRSLPCLSEYSSAHPQPMLFCSCVSSSAWFEPAQNGWYNVLFDPILSFPVSWWKKKKKILLCFWNASIKDGQSLECTNALFCHLAFTQQYSVTDMQTITFSNLH